MRVLVVLAFLTVASASLSKLLKTEQCNDGEVWCPMGCCPEENGYCCPDDIFCAATASDCPFVAKREKLMKMAGKKQCGPNETACPDGCCPFANWYCCPGDHIYCAATPADCPYAAQYMTRLVAARYF